MVHEIKTILRGIVTFPIYFYKLVISPFLPKACLYQPSCSSYALEAIQRHGILKGFVLAATRLFRCNGWFFTGGFDPVPEKFTWTAVRDGYRKFSRMKRKE